MARDTDYDVEKATTADEIKRVPADAELAASIESLIKENEDLRRQLNESRKQATEAVESMRQMSARIRESRQTTNAVPMGRPY